MKLPIGFRARTCFIALAVVALTLGSAIGWVNHSKHDSELEFDAMMYRQIAWHLQQANDCRAAEAKGLPYPKQDRLQRFEEHVKLRPTWNFSLPDWLSEARLHDDWASAMQDGRGDLYMKSPDSWSSFILDFFN